MELNTSTFAGPPSEWDARVRQLSGWTHAHLHGWKGIMEGILGHSCFYAGARDTNGVLQGVLPLVEVKSAVFGHFLVSMPFLNYGGPLGSPEAVRSLTDYARHLAEERRAGLLELRSRQPLDVSLPVSHRRITVVLDLPAKGEEAREGKGGATALWNSFDAKLRAQVRRPQKEGVTTRFGTDQVDPFYQVLARHMRDLGTPVHSRKFFEAIARAFPDDSWFGVAYLRGEPVAGGCGFRWGSEFEMTWASALRETKRIAPNMLLYWSFIERCFESGISLFNFGRCTPDSGTHRFKRQWGSRDETLWWYQHGTRGIAATPSPSDARYALGPLLWKRLPLGLANRIGPLVVRLIP